MQVLGVAREMGVLKLGTVALDGTKIHANASRHKALSYERAGKIKTKATGKKPGGKPPAPPAEEPLPTDQMHYASRFQRLCLASSNLSWGSGDSCCADWIRSVVSGTS